uniref:Uncharacterized protein n=1 Tax=Populus trichocarpa TaxID=3694 RepID=B9HBZ9_POPTR
MREGGKSFAIKNINISNHGSTINRVIFCTSWGRRMKEIEKQNKFTERKLGLGKIAKLINSGKIDSTTKILKDTGAIGKQIKNGARLMGCDAENIQCLSIWRKVLFQKVSRGTVRGKEAAGGSVGRVHYRQLELLVDPSEECITASWVCGHA